MKGILLTVLAMAATALELAAAPRFAVVRVRDIYTSLHSTQSLDKRVREEQAAIMKDQRAVELRRMLDELKEIQSRLADQNNPPEEAEGRKLAQRFELRRQEAQTLQREFENFRSEEEKAINTRMVAEMRATLNRIAETARGIAKERGIDLLLDRSGNTNTGVPFVLAAKEAPDISEDVLGALRDAGEAADPLPQPKP